MIFFFCKRSKFNVPVRAFCISSLNDIAGVLMAAFFFCPCAISLFASLVIAQAEANSTYSIVLVVCISSLNDIYSVLIHDRPILSMCRLFSCLLSMLAAWKRAISARC